MQQSLFAILRIALYTLQDLYILAGVAVLLNNLPVFSLPSAKWKQSSAPERITARVTEPLAKSESEDPAFRKHLVRNALVTNLPRQGAGASAQECALTLSWGGTGRSVTRAVPLPWASCFSCLPLSDYIHRPKFHQTSVLTSWQID